MSFLFRLSTTCGSAFFSTFLGLTSNSSCSDKFKFEQVLRLDSLESSQHFLRIASFSGGTVLEVKSGGILYSVSMSF